MFYNKLVTLSVLVFSLFFFNACDTAEDEPQVLTVTVQPGYITESSFAYKLWIIVCKENGEVVDYIKFTEAGEYALKIPKEKYDLHVAYVNNPLSNPGYSSERIYINTYRSVSARELFFRGSTTQSVALQDVFVSDIPSGSRAQVSTSSYSASIGNGGSNPSNYSFRVPVFNETNDFLITITPTSNPSQPRFSWISGSFYLETLNIGYQNLQPMRTHKLDGPAISGSYTLRGYTADEDQRYTVCINNPLLNNEIHYPEGIFSGFQFSLNIVRDSYRFTNSFSGTDVFSQPIIDPAIDLDVTSTSPESFSCATSGEYTYAYQNFNFFEYGSGFSNSISWQVTNPPDETISYSLPTLPAEVLDELPLLAEKQLSLSSAGLVQIPEINSYAEYTQRIYSKELNFLTKIFSKYRTY